MPSVVTKSDLVQVAAKAGNVSKAAAGEAVNALFDAIVDNVAKGKRVTVIGFGTFLPRKRKARAGRSPVNGKEIKISAKTIPSFAAGQGVKQASDREVLGCLFEGGAPHGAAPCLFRGLPRGAGLGRIAARSINPG